MLVFPSLHAAATIALTCVVFWMFSQGRLRVEVVCLLLIAVLALGLYFFPIDGQDSLKGLEIAFGGFGHQALVSICCLMILGRGLVATGALDPVSTILERVWRFSPGLGLLVALLLAGGISMFINDTPVLVLTLPILLSLAARTGFPASRTLMPVNAAILIGGMLTTLGTSTNLLIVSIARDLGLEPIGVFDYLDAGLFAVAVALPYLWLVMPRLLPAYESVATESGRVFSGALYLEAVSPLIGLTLDAAQDRLGGVRLHGLTRSGRDYPRHARGLFIAADDMLLVEGALDQLRQASSLAKSPLAPSHVMRAVRSGPEQDQVIAEVVVGAESSLIGQTIRSAQIAERFKAVVIGLYRPDRTFRHTALDAADETLEVGDVLLIQGLPERLRELQAVEGAMLLEGAAEIPRRLLAPAAIAIVAAVVTVAALKIFPIAIAALAGTIAMIVTGCVRFDRLDRALSGQVIVLVAASIALGRALLETGAAAWLGDLLSFGLSGLPPAIVLAAIMTFAALITNFSSNTAAAAVATPIAVSVATRLGVPPEPMVLAVLFGCNLSFATPIAYQTNILIMAAGGYQFRDFVRAGTPLVLLMVVTLSIVLVNKYGL